VFFLLVYASRFKEKYERQILAGTDKNASDRQKRIGLAVAEVGISQFCSTLEYIKYRLSFLLFGQLISINELKAIF